MEQDTDISKQTLVVLVALSCIISIIGVIALVYELSNTQAAPVAQHPQASAEASFAILGKAQPKAGSATGFATFNVGG